MYFLQAEHMNQELEERIQNELNIDISSYLNDEAIEQITDIILFPKYALQWILIPLILALGIFIAGFWIFTISTAGYIFYYTIGLFLFAIAGLLAGLYYFSYRLQGDIDGIMNYSVQITQQGLGDIKKMGSHLTGEEKGKATKLLFLGVTQLVTVPSISAVVKKKIPFIGPIIAIIVARIMMSLSGDVELTTEKKVIAADLDSAMIEEIEVEVKPSTSSKVLSKALRIVRFPIGILLIINIILLAVFLLVVT